MAPRKRPRRARYLISSDGIPVEWVPSLVCARERAVALARGEIPWPGDLLPAPRAYVTVNDTGRKGCPELHRLRVNACDPV